MVRVVSAELILQSMSYDLKRMVEEKQDPKSIKQYLTRKRIELDGNSAYKVIWWKKS